MKVRWSKRALADLRHFHDWLATIENAKPRQTIGRIRKAALDLERLGDIGRPGKIAGTRERSVPGAPYVIAYEINGENARIIAVYHTAQKR